MQLPLRFLGKWRVRATGACGDYHETNFDTETVADRIWIELKMERDSAVMRWRFADVELTGIKRAAHIAVVRC
jgi:hypothetical protein